MKNMMNLLDKKEAFDTGIVKMDFNVFSVYSRLNKYEPITTYTTIPNNNMLYNKQLLYISPMPNDLSG
jgi:hypothetical protein